MACCDSWLAERVKRFFILLPEWSSYGPTYIDFRSKVHRYLTKVEVPENVVLHDGNELANLEQRRGHASASAPTLGSYPIGATSLSAHGHRKCAGNLLHRSVHLACNGYRTASDTFMKVYKA